MPMDFPDIDSLKAAARIHSFRDYDKDKESEEEYRLKLASYVRNIDKIESFEIQFGIGWDKWTDEQTMLLITLKQD